MSGRPPTTETARTDADGSLVQSRASRQPGPSYVAILRPPLANERLLPGPDGLVRIALKTPFSDGTVAVDLDPLSLLCRLVALVPAPRFHTVRYFGVLAAAAKWRPLVVPKPQPSQATEDGKLIMGSSAGTNEWPPEYGGLTQVSLHHPGPELETNHWVTWVMGMEYVDQKPYVAALIQYQWGA